MKTALLVLSFGGLAALLAYFLELPVQPETAALATAIVVIFFRVKRAMGIDQIITYNKREWNEATQEWADVNKNMPESPEKTQDLNRIARATSARAQDDRDLRGWKW